MIGSCRVLVVDDNDSVRRQLCLLLSREDLDICGQAADGKEAIQQTEKLHPDVIVLDLRMPVMNGREAAREIRRIAPSTKIVGFTMTDGPTIHEASKVFGMDAFVQKGCDNDQLISTIKHVCAA